MVVTLRNYLKLDIKSASKRAIELIDEVKKVNAHFISLWHNQNLSSIDSWND